MPLPIHVICPKPVDAGKPPSTLSQVKQRLSDITVHKTNMGISHTSQKSTEKRYLDRLKALVSHFGTTLFHFPAAIDAVQLVRLATFLKENQSGLKLSLSCRISENDRFQSGGDKTDNIAQVQWYAFGKSPPLVFFKTFSEMGIWNHLVADSAAAAKEIAGASARQPNIIHSWETGNSGGSFGGDSKSGYGRVTTLPGSPLWRSVKIPEQRLVLIANYGKKWLMRSRVKEKDGRLYSVGETLDYHFCPPDRLPKGYLDEICAMVAAGGTVATTHVRYNLERAYLIGYVREKGAIVGNSSLKNPRPEYISSVHKQSGLDLTGYVERGYTSVRPEYRGLGIGTKLLEGLTERAGNRKIFSVISEDNDATKIIAKRNRTRKVATYFSEKTEKPVGIWMPEWMIAK